MSGSLAPPWRVFFLVSEAARSSAAAMTEVPLSAVGRGVILPVDGPIFFQAFFRTFFWTFIGRPEDTKEKKEVVILSPALSCDRPKFSVPV